MSKYAKYLFIILYCFCFSNIVYADEIATNSSTNKEYTSSQIIISPAITNKSKELLRISKNDLLLFLQNHFHWNSWTWIDKNSYICASIYPLAYLDDSIITINYTANIFPNILNMSLEERDIIIFTKFINDLAYNIIIDEYYDYYIDEDSGIINIYSESSKGKELIEKYRWVEN